MLSRILLLVTLCISSVTAFGASGAYERMLYWYAYKMEGEAGGSRTIAPTCPRPCTFQNFVKHIAKTEEEKRACDAPAVRNINGETITADEGADILHGNNIGGEYYEYRVIENVDEVPRLFELVSKRIGDLTQGKGATKGIFKQALIARKRIQQFRVGEQHLMIGNKLREEYDKQNAKPKNWGKTPQTKGVPWTHILVPENEEIRLGNGLRVLDCDIWAAARRIKSRNPQFDMASFVNKHIKDGTKHKGNVDEIRLAKGNMTKNRGCKKLTLVG